MNGFVYVATKGLYICMRKQKPQPNTHLPNSLIICWIWFQVFRDRKCHCLHKDQKREKKKKNSQTIANVTKLSFDPLEAVLYTGFYFVFHVENIIRCNSSLPLELGIGRGREPSCLRGRAIEIVWVGSGLETELARGWGWVLRKWFALLHSLKLRP